MATIRGTTGNDIITPTSVTIGVTGGYPSDAADTISASNGNDTVDGGGGDDIIDGGTGNDQLFGGAGNDSIIGGYGDDSIVGGDGDDTIDGKWGIDILSGGDGDDTFLTTSIVGDTLSGGAGYDRVLHNSAFSNIYLSFFDSLTNSIEEIANARSGVARVFGGSEDNYFDFSKTKFVNVRVDSYYGDDFIRGSDLSNDDLQGSKGDDTIYGGAANDKIDGGYDNDTLSGDGGDDLLDGNFGNDLILGGVGNDTMYGNRGVDELGGQSGNDVMYGGDDNDKLGGGTGNDQLFGDAGDDLLAGREGVDQLSGGTGNDIFEYWKPTDSGYGAAKRDVIFDFAAGDRIDLSRIDSNPQAAGDQAFKFVTTSALKVGEVNVLIRNGDAYVQANTAGTATPELEIQVKAVPGGWGAEDFIL